MTFKAHYYDIARSFIPKQSTPQVFQSGPPCRLAAVFAHQHPKDLSLRDFAPTLKPFSISSAKRRIVQNHISWRLMGDAGQNSGTR